MDGTRSDQSALHFSAAGSCCSPMGRDRQRNWIKPYTTAALGKQGTSIQILSRVRSMFILSQYDASILCSLQNLFWGKLWAFSEMACGESFPETGRNGFISIKFTYLWVKSRNLAGKGRVGTRIDKSLYRVSNYPTLGEKKIIPKCIVCRCAQSRCASQFLWQ